MTGDCYVFKFLRRTVDGACENNNIKILRCVENVTSLLWLHMNVGRFAYRMIRLQVDSPTLESIRLHVLRRFAYTELDSPKTQYRRKVN